MKIALWSAQYLPYIGGLGIMVHSLAMELKRQGHELLILSNHCEEHLEIKTIEINRLKVHLFPFERALMLCDFRAIRSILEKIDALLNQFSPDLIHIHGWIENFCFYQLRALEKREIPTFLTVHGLLEQTHCKQGQQCFALLKKVRAVTTVSHALMRCLREECGVKHDSLFVIYNGMRPSTPPPQPPPKEKRLLVVGRLVEEKCIDMAFYALKKLICKYPDLKLTVLGEGELLPDLLALKTTLQLEDSIEMVGAVSPHLVTSYIDQTQLVLVPSRYESFSLTALEAAFRSRAVVASDVYGLREVVEQATTGLLVEPKNPDAIAAAVERLFEDEKGRFEMGQAALARAKEKFQIATCAKNYEEMYRQILCKTS